MESSGSTPSSHPLARLYLGALRAKSMTADALDDLERALAALAAAGAAEWPGLPVAPEALVTYAALHLDAGEDPASVVASLRAGELHLACCVAAGDAAAARAFEDGYVRFVPQFIASMGLPDELVDEARQRVRVRLLVGEGDSPGRIAKYNGRGPLGGWLRVVALHVARDLLRERKREVPLEPDAQAAVVGADLELAFLKTRYAREFRAAFEATLAQLELRDRNILRMHFVRNLTTDAIGRIYGVDGSTVRRRIATARHGVLDDTRRRLREKLELQPSEVESLIRLLESQLDVSVARLLARS